MHIAVNQPKDHTVQLASQASRRADGHPLGVLARWGPTTDPGRHRAGPEGVEVEPILEDFGAVVRGEVAPLVNARDGLANLRVTQAIVAAAKSGTTIEVDNT